MTMRLDTGSNVNAYENLHTFTFTLYSSTCEFHLAAMEVGGIISIFATAMVFSMALVNVPFNVSMVLLIALGSIMAALMTYVFFNTAKTHNILVKKVVLGLNAQRRKNNVEIDWLEVCSSEGDLKPDAAAKIRDLRSANSKIVDLAEKIVDEHKPVLLWHVLPLTKENVIELGGALAASLFTTVLRMALASRVDNEE